MSKKEGRLEQELNLHITATAKPNEADYEMPCTLGTRGRRNWRLKTAAEGANAENQRSLEKLLVFLNLLMPLKRAYDLLVKQMQLNFFGEA
jgi:hypothetical protein